MKVKKVPQRQCIACRTQRPKRELLRIVRNPDGALMFDPKGKMSGRGAYLCVSQACFRKAVKNKLFTRHLRVEPNAELINQLEYLLGDGTDQA